MAGVTATLALSLAARLTGTAVGGDVPQHNTAIERILRLEPGTDALNKADLLYRATRVLAASANEDLDLAGVLVNAFGAVFGAGEVIVLLIEADAGNTNNVRFGPAAATAFTGPFADATDRLNIKPGEYALLVSPTGWAVVGGASDKINVLNAAAGTAVTYTITVIARSVAA